MAASRMDIDFEGKLKDFTDAEARPMCYAHRGDIESYPENSIEAVISAVKKGADMIELDVCMTRDKVLVLMHGEDLSVTTDWALKRGQTVNGIKLPVSSSISAWTYEQLCQLRLRTGNGEYSAADSEITDYIIPTLKEAFIVCNERSLLVLDRVTTSHWDKIYEIIKETRHTDASPILLWLRRRTKHIIIGLFCYLNSDRRRRHAFRAGRAGRAAAG